MDTDKIILDVEKYFIYGAVLGIVFVVVDIVLFQVNGNVAGLLLYAIVIFYVALFILYKFSKRRIHKEVVDYVLRLREVQNEIVEELPIPYVLVEENGDIMWENSSFHQLIKDQDVSRLQQIFPDLNRRLMASEMNHSVTHVKRLMVKGETQEECFYKVEFRRIHLNQNENKGEKSASMIAAYFFDQGLLKKYMDESESQRMAVGLIYIDNYDDVLESVDEMKQTMLLAVADRRITKYIQNYSGIIKKTEKDRYFVIFPQKNLENMKKDEFSILEDIKTINIGNSMNITLSISIGINGNTYQESYESATAGMDLALGRGGDQLVIKDGDEITYFGGNSTVYEKNTRVKARVKAHALKELLESKENIIIMAHKIPDPDAIGAAVGLYRLGLSLERKAHIVMNEMTISVRPIVTELQKSEEYDEGMFISNEEAIEITDENTLLIVVDVNHASYTECERLLQLTNTIVILDHHRKAKNAISNPVLSYIEPYASSTCELVAEILQYIDTKPKLSPDEANAMYFGMLVDTDNFVNKTGVRTFEAAAYLRRNGADLTKVRKLSRTTMDSYRLKAKCISNAHIIDERFAMTTLVGVGMDSPTVLGAQVANELLDIQGIQASFVLTGVEERVYVSARSIDEINVQKIMEQFGGGGHLTVAGAQLVDVSLEEAEQIIRETLQDMISKGEI